MSNTSITVDEAFQIAQQLHNQSEFEQAQHIYQQILAVAPHHFPTLHALGILFAQTQHSEAGIQLLTQALHVENSPYVHNDLGKIYGDSNHVSQAIAHYKQAIELAPNFIQAYVNLGLTLSQQQQYAEAIQIYQQGLQINSSAATLYLQLGDVFETQHQFELAINAYQQAIRLDSQNTKVHNNLGAVYAQLNQHAKAIECYQAALQIDPHYAKALYNLGYVLASQGQSTRAIQAYQQALALQPDYTDALINLGSAYKEQANIQQAIECYQQVLKKEPTNVLAWNNLLYTIHLTTEFSQADIFKLHQQFAQNCAAKHSPVRLKNTTKPRIKLAYLSPDLRTHSVAYFMEAILANHDQQQFEICVYYTYPHQDDTSQRFKSYVSHWFNCAYWSDDQLTEHISQQSIDILVDLAGHTAHNRLSVLARKPAPIQITYLGYPDTTGLSTIDYRITDNYTDPPGAEKFSTEKLLKMPHSYFCYSPPNNSPAVNELPALKNGYVTFGSFNNYPKLTTAIINCWIAILQAVPNAKLLLKAKAFCDEQVKTGLIHQFTQAGIDIERLTLMEMLPSTHDHLSIYHHIDIGLDTFPYNGATTTCEALWLGVPVVTLVGKTHVSRVGLSLLATLGAQELVTDTPDDYITTCINLASNIKRLENYRLQLRKHMLVSALMEKKTFTQQLENNYIRSYTVETLLG